MVLPKQKVSVCYKKWSAFYQINVNDGGKKRQHSDKHTEVHCSVWHFANIQVKTPNHNTCHSGIQGCVVCPVCPSGIAILCCPIGKYAQPIIFGDTERTLRMLELCFSWQSGDSSALRASREVSSRFGMFISFNQLSTWPVALDL